eukprot:gene27483-49097_t
MLLNVTSASFVLVSEAVQAPAVSCAASGNRAWRSPCADCIISRFISILETTHALSFHRWMCRARRPAYRRLCGDATGARANDAAGQCVSRLQQSAAAD